MNPIFDTLNDRQCEAVNHTKGPLLITAGAGSGKTKVLTCRIAHLLELGVSPYRILAITFTNKAAKEMKERVQNLVGAQADSIWLSTFHSFCAKLLRFEIDGFHGYTRNFTIYDSSDQLVLIKDCLKKLNLDDKQFTPRSVLGTISAAKNVLMDAKTFAGQAEDFYQQKVSEAYALYQAKLKENNALDFDDLLFLAVRLLEEKDDVREKYQERFQYVLVDEYQDTNHAQYALTKILAAQWRNICVVGDADQSIYAWRGADIRNIIDFTRDYPDAASIKLEQNYRSTKTILNAANAVIDNNESRPRKTLWTENPSGNKVIHYQAQTEHDEADYIAGAIYNRHEISHEPYGDMAILIRTNAQSRVLEEKLMRYAIPYTMVGGTKFYDRKEIRDIIAYMSIVENPNDRVRFERIVNEPKRGIGDATLSLLQDITQDLHLSPLEVMRNADQYPVLSKKMNALKKFAVMWDELIEAERELPLEKFLDVVLEKTGYRAALEQMGEEGTFRLENVEELKSSILTYQNEAEEPSLGGFLEEISLYTDVDKYEPEQDVVMLMTVHSAKGLEFQNVFLVGMEQGVFPGNRSLDSREDLEEERRLAYVALTRAKKKLTLTTAASRMLFGMTMRNLPSQFLTEIDRQLIEQETSQRQSRRGISADKPESVQSISLQRQMASAKPQKYKAEPKEFHVGERVRHAVFGDGTVLAITKMANDAMLEVGFDQVGTKRLMASHPKIKKLL